MQSIDSGFNESYVKLLEEGKTLTIRFNTFILRANLIQVKTVAQASIARTLTRLKSIIVPLLRKGFAVGSGVGEFTIGATRWKRLVQPDVV